MDGIIKLSQSKWFWLGFALVIAILMPVGAGAGYALYQSLRGEPVHLHQWFDKSYPYMFLVGVPFTLFCHFVLITVMKLMIKHSNSQCKT